MYTKKITTHSVAKNDVHEHTYVHNEANASACMSTDR